MCAPPSRFVCGSICGVRDRRLGTRARVSDWNLLSSCSCLARPHVSLASDSLNTGGDGRGKQVPAASEAMPPLPAQTGSGVFAGEKAGWWHGR